MPTKFWNLADNPTARLAIRAGGILVLIVLLTVVLPVELLLAQDGDSGTPAPGESDEITTPDRVDVEPQARDEAIRQRLGSIFAATDWFIEAEVHVEEGVVFLEGRTDSEEYKAWAGNLAQRTEDVVAVVNRIEVVQPSVWDFEPALANLREQLQQIVRAFPLVLFSLAILGIAWFVAHVAGKLTKRTLHSRDLNRLLTSVIARGVSIFVFLIGMYVVFQVAGLASVALTVLGGTGLLGLVLGIAFQDITENFLASILLSIQSPFRSGDLVQIDDVTGFVQMMTLRTTVLMTQDGNHVQIPNATVYKSKIYNYTSNPNRRVDFLVGIGYDDSVVAAQDLVLEVLREHPAVLADPEPWVLVESLGSVTVNLRIYFWLDGSVYSWQKVRSAVIRLVKRAFQAAEISMPGDTRELLFPDVVAIQQVEAADRRQLPVDVRAPIAPPAEEPASISTDAEAGLRSDAVEIEKQARDSRSPEEGTNLLDSSSDD